MADATPQISNKAHTGSPQLQGKASKCTSVHYSAPNLFCISYTQFGLPAELSQSPSHPVYNTHPMAGEPGNPETYFHPCGKLRCWEFVYPPLTLKCLPG